MPGVRTELIQKFQYAITRVIGKYKTKEQEKCQVEGLGFFITPTVVVTSMQAVEVPCGIHREASSQILRLCPCERNIC